MHTRMHTHTVHLREEQKRQNPTEERKRFPRKRTALHGHGACDTVSSSAPRLGPRPPHHPDLSHRVSVGLLRMRNGPFS